MSEESQGWQSIEMTDKMPELTNALNSLTAAYRAICEHEGYLAQPDIVCQDDPVPAREQFPQLMAAVASRIAHNSLVLRCEGREATE